MNGTGSYAQTLSARHGIALSSSWIIAAGLLMGSLVLFSSCDPAGSASAPVIYPDADWETASPDGSNVDLDALGQIDSIMHAAHSNGVLVVDGKIVKQWTYDGPIDKKIEVQSITKTMVSLLLGIAIDEGRISDINDKVKEYYPAFEAGPHTDAITFKHLVTTSSGIEAKKYGYNYMNPNNMPPGIDARYHNDHFDQLARALTYIYKQPLLEVFSDRVLSKTGGTVEWRTDGEIALEDGTAVPVHAGYAFTQWNAPDLARIGWLFLNNGYWRGDKIISPGYAGKSRTALDIPVMTRRNGEPVVDSASTYGYGWRGIFTNDKRDILWYMSGNGGQMCVVLPEKNIVFVKINGFSEPYRPFRGAGLFRDPLLNLRSDNHNSK